MQNSGTINNEIIIRTLALEGARVKHTTALNHLIDHRETFDP